MLVAAAMAGLGVRTLGGYTGDTLGATEQLAECAVLLVLATLR
jgi:cobalamin synthase